MYYPAWFEGEWSTVSAATDVLAPAGVPLFGGNASFARAKAEIEAPPLSYRSRWVRAPMQPSMLPRADEDIDDDSTAALARYEDDKAACAEEVFEELAGGAPSEVQLTATKAILDSTDASIGVAVLGPAGCGKSVCVRAACGMREVETKLVVVAPGTLSLDDCFGGASGSQGCVVSRFSQLAESRADANQGDTWIVLDGPIEGHWTEDMTILLDKSADRAEHGASPVRYVLETDEMASAAPSTVSRIAVVCMTPFSEATTTCARPAAARARAWCDRRLRVALENADRGLVADALDDYLGSENCCLDEALELARKLDEHRYLGFEYAVDEDDPINFDNLHECYHILSRRPRDSTPRRSPRHYDTRQ